MGLINRIDHLKSLQRSVLIFICILQQLNLKKAMYIPLLVQHAWYFEITPKIKYKCFSFESADSSLNNP